MTITEYSYTETDIYRAIVQTAVPIALTEKETGLIVEALIRHAAMMPHDSPAAVFFDWQLHNDTESWSRRVGDLVIASRRTASLERITRQRWM